MMELLWKAKARKAKDNEKGFTLVELIVVVAIIGILAAVAIARMGGFGDSARNGRVESEHRMLVGAIQMYQSEKGIDTFPTSIADLDDYVSGGDTKLSTKKDGTTAAHSIGTAGPGTSAGEKGQLISTYDDTKVWTYNESTGIVVTP